jgi:tetrahydromethanopterin S-methyltransferase subunit B
MSSFKETFLNFLGNCAYPISLIPNANYPPNTNFSIDLDLKAPNGTKVIYWAAENNKDKKYIFENPVDAYGKYENSGVAIVNNNKWFNNNLQEDEIHEFFRPSLNTEQDTMTVMISDIRDIIITHNESVIDSLENIDLKNPHIELSLEIEAQGLYFFPKKFGIRWIVNKLSIYNSDLISSENTIDSDNLIDKVDIENEWECEVDTIKESIEKDITIFKSKITSLEKYSNDIQESLETAKNTLDIGEWNAKLIDLSHKIAKYYGGITTADMQ